MKNNSKSKQSKQLAKILKASRSPKGIEQQQRRLQQSLAERQQARQLRRKAQQEEQAKRDEAMRKWLDKQEAIRSGRTINSRQGIESFIAILANGSSLVGIPRGNTHRSNDHITVEVLGHAHMIDQSMIVSDEEIALRIVK